MKSHNEESKYINIIHLSDLHAGLNNQEWMWPSVKAEFFKDLTRIHKKSGEFDLVIFSGDLTQKASCSEFENLTKILKEIWGHFKTLNCNPSLFVTPGNHDLERPGEIDSNALILSEWWSRDAIHSNFWNSNDSTYRKTIDQSFQNYSNWMQGLILENEIPVLKSSDGILPGDSSAVFKKDLFRIGLVSINSTWLQLNGGDWKGKLCIHPNQLMALTENKPDEWTAQNDDNFLITHHPTSWLHKNSVKLWNSDIYTHNRFTAHIFGHMHEGELLQISNSGGARKLSLQAPSIFGLEKYSNELKRSHGYLLIQIPVDKKNNMRIWPRSTVTLRDGGLKLIADPAWDMEDDFIEVKKDLIIPPGAEIIDSNQNDNNVNALLSDNSHSYGILNNLRKSGNYSKAAASVRIEEQQLLCAALKTKRLAWVTETWGIGGDEFLSATQEKVVGQEGGVYYLSIGNYQDSDTLLKNIRIKIGCSLEELCKGLDQQNPSILVFDDVQFEDSRRVDLETDLIRTAKTIIEFSDKIHIVIKSRKQPETNLISTVNLKPLDEADVATYIASKQNIHIPQHGSDIAKKILNHSGGIPARIDSLLREIEIVGIQGLYELDMDVVGKLAAVHSDTSEVLVETINELINSKDDLLIRALSLLKVLALFPQGEPLNRVKRFFGAKPFWHSHASLLIQRGLIESNPVIELSGSFESSPQGNALIVKRPVREYLIQNLDASELKKLNSKALELYFGPNWSTSGIKPPSDIKFSNPRCGALEIENACMLILREAKSATESNKLARIQSALSLTESFSSQLVTGDHFRNVSLLLDLAIPIFAEYSQKQNSAKGGSSIDLSILMHCHARVLRMIDEDERAIEIANSIKTEGKSKDFIQRLLLTTALCKESINAPSVDIIKAAEECIAIDTKSRIALNARYIVATHEDSDNKVAKLRALLEEATKRDAAVVANNIALDLAKESQSTEQKLNYLNSVMKSGKSNNDHYNFVRALLRNALLNLKENNTLPKNLLNECILAYTYIYNQRIDGMFDDCHKVLWLAFESAGDIENLLTLYRYSSLIWRLRKKNTIENTYHNTLSNLLGAQSDMNILTVDRNLRYFISRGAATEN